jgi:hypothetical protein
VVDPGNKCFHTGTVLLITDQTLSTKSKEWNMSYSSTGNGIAGALVGSFLVILIISLAFTVFFAIVYWKIFAKAGYSGAMGLLMFVPIANIIVLCMLPSPQMMPSPQHPSSPQYPQYGQPPRHP